jgi:hypothetical protein
MKVDEEVLNSWSEVAIQDLLMDVAAAVDATESDRASNRNVPSGPNVVSLGNLRPGSRYGQRWE